MSSLIGLYKGLPETDRSWLEHRRRVETQAVEVARATENLAKMGAVPTWSARSKRAEANREARQRRDDEERILKKHGLYKAPKPKATLTPIMWMDKPAKRGLLYDIEFLGRRGKIGRSEGAPPHDFYIVVDGAFLSGGYKTLALATKAFEKGAS